MQVMVELSLYPLVNEYISPIQDFIDSNLHKWSVDKRYSKIFKENNPDIGLHWYILN